MSDPAERFAGAKPKRARVRCIVEGCDDPSEARRSRCRKHFTQRQLAAKRKPISAARARALVGRALDVVESELESTRSSSQERLTAAAAVAPLVALDRELGDTAQSRA